MSKLTEGWKNYSLRDLVVDERPICYGVLKPGDFIPDGVPLVRIVDIANGQIDLAGLHRISVPLDAEFRRSKLLGGEVLVSIQGTIGRAAVAPLELAGANISRTIARIAVNDFVISGFLSQWLRSPYGQRELDKSVLGTTRDSLNIGVLRRIKLAVPPVPEQRKITEILDAADESIRSTERLIAKLEQAKRGLVHDLLTRDTSDWRTSNADSEFDIKSGITLGPGRIPRNHPKSYLRVANVQRDRINISDIAALEASPADSIDYALIAGDLLVVEGHASPWEIGRCAMVEEGHAGLLYQNHLFRLRTRKIFPRFALLWLNSAFSQNYWWRMCATSSGLNTINSRQLRALPVLVPDEEEQARIVHLAAGISSRLSAEHRELDKLRLLKRGLMDDLLTGRVLVGASG